MVLIGALLTGMAGEVFLADLAFVILAQSRSIWGVSVSSKFPHVFIWFQVQFQSKHNQSGSFDYQNYCELLCLTHTQCLLREMMYLEEIRCVASQHHSLSHS